MNAANKTTGRSGANGELRVWTYDSVNLGEEDDKNGEKDGEKKAADGHNMHVNESKSDSQCSLRMNLFCVDYQDQMYPLSSENE